MSLRGALSQAAVGISQVRTEEPPAEVEEVSDVRIMAKKKRSRRGPSLLTKAINIGVLALAFAPVLSRLTNPERLKELPALYTGGLIEGKFNKAWLMEAYGSIIGAILLKKAISMVRKSARI